MPKPRTLEIDAVEIFRQRLLEQVLSENKDSRVWKREAVKRVLSALIAARESGMTFDAISEMAAESGLNLPPDTLRCYYYELKTQSELAAESVRHAQRIAQTRASIHKQRLESHTQHGLDTVARHVSQAAPRLQNLFWDVPASENGSASETPPRVVRTKQAPSRNSPTEAIETAHQTARPASPAAPVPPPAAPEPARFESEGAVPGTVADVKYASTLPTSEKASRATPDIQSEGGMTLADIERASLATEERTELLGDVELRAGELVYYVSGQPFHGLLSQRQIRLLRTVGRIIAPTKCRSSKDFVSMPTKL